jgi:ribose 1,5-bisphosphokinase
VLPETVLRPVASARHGTFVAVVGPSGAGKDSLITAARLSLAEDPRFVFARRLITRAADASEAHDSMDAEQFAALESVGGFALSWHANGLGYALPLCLSEAYAEGRVIVANLSREIIPVLRGRFASTLVIHVTARVETLRARIAQRGREGEAERELRIARSMLLEGSIRADIRISNDGNLEEAAAQFRAVLIGVAA